MAIDSTEQNGLDTIRITYPLSDVDIKELEELEGKLKQFAEAAEQGKKVALHRVYHDILKYSSTCIARAKLRSTREANAERSKRHKSLKQVFKQEVLSTATGANGAGNL